MSRCHSGMSHAEIGAILGMSRQNVQLIERRALNKLRSAVGSTFRGKWMPYDSEGVPEPQGDTRDYRTPMKNQPRKARGRFA